MKTTLPSEQKESKKSEPARVSARVGHVASTWTVENYKSILTFHIKIIPQIMGCERCAVYLVEPGAETTCRLLATGIMEKMIPFPDQESIPGKAIFRGTSLIANNLVTPADALPSWGEEAGVRARNTMCAPLSSLTGLSVRGALQIINKKNGQFEPEDKTRLLVIATYLSISMESIMLNRELLSLCNILLSMQKDISMAETGETFIAKSAAARRLRDQIQILQKNSANVLIYGAEGTEKEVVARSIHRGSRRRDRPFLRVNCAIIPDNLAESEFFGHEKGSFTGAETAQEGLLEKASGGTLFLENVTELPGGIQQQLLRALKEGKGFRHGSSQVSYYDLRFICSTSKDSQELAGAKLDRELLYHLSTVKVTLPPLQNRREDLVPMALALLGEISARISRTNKGFSKEVLELIECYHWPENFSQMQSEIERLVALTDSDETITLEKCSLELQEFYRKNKTIKQKTPERSSLPEQVTNLEKALIASTLEATRYNKVKAAQILGITRQGLHKKIKRYQIE